MTTGKTPQKRSQQEAKEPKKPRQPAKTHPPQPSDNRQKVGSVDYSQAQQISELEQELKSTREYLQTVIEELETTNKELKSANEELVIVNTDLQAKVDDLTSTNDIKNLMDVNQIKQAEEKLQFQAHLLDIVKQAIIVTDPDTTITYWNPYAEKLYGWSATEAIGKTTLDLIATDDSLRHGQEIMEFLRDGKSWSGEYLARNRDGKDFPIQVMLSPLYAEDGNIQGVIGISQDITDRKQVENTLRENEKLFRTLWNTTVDAQVLSNSEGIVLAANSAYLQLYGYTEEEVVGKSFTIIFPEDRRQWAMEQYHITFTSPDVPPVFETEIQRPDGTTRTVESRISFLSDDGKRTSMLSSIRDITERKQAEEALRESEAKLRTLFDLLPVGVSVLSPERQLIDINTALKRILSIDRTALFRGDYAQRRYLRADGTPLPPTEFASMRAVAEQQPIYNVKTGVVKEDGDIVWMEVSAAPLPDGRVVVVTTDITERKQAEEALRESEENLRITLNSIGDAVIATGTNGLIVRMNPVAERLSGWSKAEAVGESFSQVFPLIQAQSRAPIPSPVEAVLQTGQMIELAKDTILIAKDGEEYYVADSGAPIQNPQGEIIGVVLVLRDVTQQIQSEQELLKARKLESVGVLAGGIAHDFNNLLTALLGHIEMAKLELPPPHQSYQYLEAASNAIERATGLTKQLLTFAKGGAPVKKIQDISSLLVETATFAMHGSKSKLDITIAPDLWPAEVDEGQLGQVIHNLIINAQQAMLQGGKITLNALNVEIDGQPFVKITVQDEGNGIAPENLEKIFDPYFTTKSDSSGLGLATTHSIITKHGGQITVDSPLNRGVVFSIYLPANPKASFPSPTTPIEETPVAQINSARILVLDDEVAIRAMLEIMLTRMGYQATFTEEGQATIAAYQEALDQGKPYQAVILDLTIPGGIGGQEVAQKILAIDPEAKLVVSSGYATDPVMADYEAYGFKARVEKPYQLATLRQVLQTVLS